MSYVIAYTDAENTFQADQVLENGVELKGKSFDDSKELNIAHVDGDNIVQIGDKNAPTHLQGKNILINGRDLEGEIEKLFLYGSEQKRKITDSVNSLFNEVVVSMKSSWGNIEGALEKKAPYGNFSFFIPPQRHSYISQSKYTGLSIFGTEKWIKQSYVIMEGMVILFGGEGYVDGQKKRVDYVATIELKDYSTEYTPTLVPRRKDDILLQDVHLVGCQKSVYVIPKVIASNSDKRIRQYAINSDTWTTASLLLDLEVGDVIDGATEYKDNIYFSVNNGRQIISFDINTRVLKVSGKAPINHRPKVDEVIFTKGKIYCVSFEQEMTSYEVLKNIPTYDVENEKWELSTGNNIGGSIFRVGENYYNFQQPRTSFSDKHAVILYDYQEDRMIGIRSHTCFQEYRNRVFFGLTYTEGGSVALLRINGAYLFNSRLTIPISSGDAVVVSAPCNVYVDGTSPSSTQGMYPDIKKEFYFNGFIQIEPMDVTKYVYGGVIKK